MFHPDFVEIGGIEGKLRRIGKLAKVFGYNLFVADK